MGWRDWQRRRIEVPLDRQVDTWRVGGPDVHTCVAPPGFEKDPAVTAAIREFDPGVIPMWRVQIWLPPGEFQPYLAVHHVIGRHYPHPRYLRRQFHVEVPQGWEGPVPNFLDAVLEDREATKWTGPAGYLPWDWSAYRWCRFQYEALTVAAYYERVKAARERQDRARDGAFSELEYRTKDFERWALHHLEKHNVSDQDWQEYQELVRRGRQRKPFVQMPGPAAAPRAFTPHGAAPREG